MAYVCFQLLNSLFEWDTVEKEKRSRSHDETLKRLWSVLWPGVPAHAGIGASGAIDESEPGSV